MSELQDAACSAGLQATGLRATGRMGDPPLSEYARRWLSRHCDPGHVERYFLHPKSLAILGFPWWLEESLCGTVDPGFQVDLMSSTINAYFFTRMLDDIMDGHSIERAAMPALYPFHYRFVRPYQKYFEYDNAFWSEFERILNLTVEAVAGEAALDDISAQDFLRFSARKPAAAAIPMAAVCARYGRTDMLEPWEEVLTSFARWHQMQDDVLDWNKDMQAGQATWILSEAARRCDGSESVAEWMGHEGFRWAMSVMDAWMSETMDLAGRLNSEPLIRYLERRNQLFSREIGTMIATANAFAGLLEMDRR